MKNFVIIGGLLLGVGIMVVGAFLTLGMGALDVAKQYTGCSDGGAQIMPQPVEAKADGWSPEQLQIANIAIGIGVSRGDVSRRDIKIALMAAMQESGLQNLTYGDAASHGVLQQQSGPGFSWGTLEETMDPVHAFNIFYDRLVGIVDRDSMPEWEAAADVQLPYEPYRTYYQKWEPDAAAMVDSALPLNPPVTTTAQVAATVPGISVPGQQPMTTSSALSAPSSTTLATIRNGGLSGCAALGSGTIEATIRVGLSQVGESFTAPQAPPASLIDGAAFVQWAYQQTEVPLPATAAEQLQAGGERITDPAKLERGDVVYWASNPQDPATINRVGIFLENDQILEASQGNPSVRVSVVQWDSLVGGIRPVKEDTEFKPTGGWHLPLDGEIYITSPFGYRIHPIKGESILHDGTDFGASAGTPILAVCDGEVTMYGPNGGFGNYAEQRCISDGAEFGYGHMSEYAEGITVGSNVHAGQVIGYVGSTGASTGPHLHLLLHVNGEPTDPVQFLQERGVQL